MGINTVKVHDYLDSTIHDLATLHWDGLEVMSFFMGGFLLCVDEKYGTEAKEKIVQFITKTLEQKIESDSKEKMGASQI